jgi:hypothetical protein
MRRPALVSFATLASAFALGCDDQASPTALDDTPAPSFGATVTRDPEPFGFGFGNEQYTIFIGLTVEDLTSIFCTGSEFDVDIVNGFHVFRPDGSRKDQLKGDVNVVVVRAPSFFTSFCDDPLPPTFTGTARLSINDNDFFVTGNRADASMLHLTGRVTDESGRLYHLTVASSQVLAPGHPAPDFVVQHFRLQIHLRPIGH